MEKKGVLKIMADYKKMYLTLLDGIEKTIASLQEIERQAEEIYIKTER